MDPDRDNDSIQTYSTRSVPDNSSNLEVRPSICSTASFWTSAVLELKDQTKQQLGDVDGGKEAQDHHRSLISSSSRSWRLLDTADAMLMDDDSDTRPQVEEEQEREEDLVFSAEDDIDKEELSRCWKLLLSRERPVYYRVGRVLNADGAIELHQRLLALRFRDYKMLKEGSLNWDDTAPAVPATEIEYPDEVYDWDDPFKPGPSIFGWTYDTQYFDLAELDDYQRIVPTRADVDEYYDWEKYRLIFSCYETDEAYVKYWDQLTKQMKWVEDALLLGHKQFSMRYDDRGGLRAVKIAAGFCHLPASLATLGFEEYVLDRQYDLDCRKGYDLVYFEVWKRISKQEMSFKEALKDILSSENKLSTSCLLRIQAEIKGCGLMRCDYRICMDYIQKLVVKGGEGAVSKKHFTEAVYSKIPIPKMYVDYAKKKLEVARRIHLMPDTGMGLPRRIENGQSDSENGTVC